MQTTLQELSERIAALEAGGGASGQDASSLAALYNERGCLRFREAQRSSQTGYAASLEDFEAALRLAPDFAAALNNRACVRAEQGDYSRARADLSRARQKDQASLEARDNHHLLCLLVDLGPTPRVSTISSLEAGGSESFCVRLAGFLEQSVPAKPGFEDCREDAIGEVIARVLAHSQTQGVDASTALRELRSSTTRGWVRDLMQRFARRGSGLDVEEVAASRAAESPSSETPPPATTSLRLDEMADLLIERLLAQSRVGTRQRRKIVWDLYLRGLLDGIRLSRAEVIAAARKLGLSKRAVSDHQLNRDLDILARALRGEGAGPEEE